MRHRLKRDILEGHYKGEGALASLKGAVIVAHKLEIIGHMVGDLGQPVLIAQDLGDSFGLA